MKRTQRNWVLLLLLIMVLLTPATLGEAADYPRLRLKGTVKYIASQDTYGIWGENGKKYQPVKQLPKEFRKDGTEVVIEARERRDIVGTRMWGTAIEVLSIMRADLYISPEDKQAIALLLRRMEAFNNRDLTALQKIDTMAGGLTADDFTAWLGSYSGFTLHYVETAGQGRGAITGFCLYSRKLENGLSLSGDIQYSLMQFELKQTNGEWLFAGTRSYRPAEATDWDSYISQLQAAAKTRFGTDNLAAWKG